MAKRNRDLAQQGLAASPPGAARPPGWHPVAPSRSGTVVHRVLPAHLACRIGAAISVAPAGSADPARERGREAPAPPHGATGGAGTSAHRTR